ncbi:MAG: ferritin family protein [Proteobacteria bacterium]|nr:ferritin family protein [Pseudomonadota bacterium]
MSTFASVDEILDFAINKEQEAADFYTDLAGRVDRPWMAETFTSFARQEMGHKAKLEGVKKGQRLAPAQGKVQDLKIAEYLVDVEPAPKMDYQDALVLAMKREKAAFRLYSDLAEATDDAGLKDTFETLAQEEARHKLKIEIEYDDRILRDN